QEAGRSCRSRAHAQLRVDVLEVLAHRRRRDPEELGDLRVRLPPRDQSENLPLAWRQAGHVAGFFEQQRVAGPGDRKPPDSLFEDERWLVRLEPAGELRWKVASVPGAKVVAHEASPGRRGEFDP